MISKATDRPVNSVVFLEDLKGGDVPEWQDGQLVLSTQSGIMILCYPEPDGPTQFTMGPGGEVEPDFKLVFDGTLETPSRTVKVVTVDERTLLQEPVSNSKSRVRVWLNHDRWPDKVVIGLD